ncbi:hypothetical protein [Streptomyces sp. 2224.1]|uniref:hypothetical protein n=1 Tax=Streptomyces sp. 2224.1 TaxID=1881020 RepID=UPI000B89E8F3|nr:hypothetical protein [Streptomyces sp. 2224.1]
MQAIGYDQQVGVKGAVVGEGRPDAGEVIVDTYEAGGEAQIHAAGEAFPQGLFEVGAHQRVKGGE